MTEFCEWASASLLFVAQTVEAQGEPETSTDYLLGRLGVLYVGMGHEVLVNGCCSWLCD